ncbi:hypothetical protein EYC98_20270 [Halieaceae bacterium IMCC14734]|uniref:PilY1 beta-propeller domain-containing protein n=1 Tax=Candidatus Litorirhabdus singularis TaxID=2518993 RepID=A0ABT3TP83_9GAMM|nr:PilC/PilY family type IV pilus protein [Candidatus Litorirhabdus singularis]MCX2983204.1 hypothetical protein [Candidatus Litorirhabdus singularis]
MIGSGSILTCLVLLLALAQTVHATVVTASRTPSVLPAVVLRPASDAAPETVYTVSPSGDVLAWKPPSFALAQPAAALTQGLQWSAQERMRRDQLTTGKDWSTQRSIFTWDRSARTQVELHWELLPAHLQRQLINSSPHAAELGSAALVSYLRGDRSNEGAGGLLPQRESLLGDTRSSQPVFVDAIDGTQTARVYVGNRSGVLHALDADTGQENWAYLPSSLVCVEKLAHEEACLSQPAQMAPAVGKVEVLGQWRNVLVTGLGGAAAGWFALDVTALETSASAPQSPTLELQQRQYGQRPIVLWELGAVEDPGIGHSYGKPAIARLGDGTTYVITGNGYNSQRGEAALYLIRISDGHAIRLGTGSGTPTNPNGMSAPALIDSDFDGVVDRVYAGDALGQLWKFDLSSALAQDWSVDGTEPLFYAGTTHPIFLAPEVAVRPDGGILVYVATGHAGFTHGGMETSQQLIIAVGDSIVPAEPGNALVLLPETTLEAAGIEQRVRQLKQLDNADLNAMRAWQVYLPAGLLPVSPLRMRGGRLWVSLHNLALRTNTQLALDYQHGDAPASPSFDLNDDGKIDAADTDDAGIAPVGVELGTGLWSAPAIRPLTAGYDMHLRVNMLEAGNAEPVAGLAPVVIVAGGRNFQPGRRSWIDITAD